MKLLILLALATALHAEDATLVKLSPEVEVRIKAEVDKQVVPLREQIAYLQRKLQMYQQGLFACQDAQIDAQAKRKPEEKAK